VAGARWLQPAATSNDNASAAERAEREGDDERDIGTFLARTGGDAARLFLPGNVWIVSARTLCYRVEIYDGRRVMALKYRLVTLFVVLFREPFADRRR
jgi:hypothetical protein